MLGLYVSDHPLFGVEHIIAAESDFSVSDLMGDDTERPRSGDRSEAQIVKVGGILSGVQRKVTKAGEPVGGRHPGGPGRGDRGDVLPADLRRVRRLDHRGRGGRGEGPGRPQGRRAKLIAIDLTVPDLSAADSAPFVVNSFRGKQVKATAYC